MSEPLPTLSTRLAKVRILVVDDDPEMLQLLRNLLSKLGFQHIITATDGREGIRQIKASIANKTEIDLVLTDWVMSPMDGVEMMQFLRTSPDSPSPHIPIIVLSGRGEWNDVEKARDAGFNEYLIKPFTAKSLCQRITWVVDKPREFVMSPNYKGPCRRRRGVHLPEGVESDRRVRDLTTITPGKALKGKIGFDITMQQVLTPKVMEVAQKNIDIQAPQYRDLARKETIALMKMYREASLGNDVAKYLSQIKSRAFNLKSKSGIFGYSLASKVAHSLYMSCEHPLANEEHHLLVIQKHVETLYIIFEQDIKGEGDQLATDLLHSLETLINKYRKST